MKMPTAAALIVVIVSGCASNPGPLPTTAPAPSTPPAVTVMPAAGAQGNSRAPVLASQWLDEPATNAITGRSPALPLVGDPKLTEAAYQSIQEPRPEPSTVNVGASASVETQLSDHFYLRRSGAYWQPVRVP